MEAENGRYECSSFNTGDHTYINCFNSCGCFGTHRGMPEQRGLTFLGSKMLPLNMYISLFPDRISYYQIYALQQQITTEKYLLRYKLYSSRLSKGNCWGSVFVWTVARNSVLQARTEKAASLLAPLLVLHRSITVHQTDELSLGKVTIPAQISLYLKK